MAKRETKETYKDSKTERASTSNRYDTAIGGSQGLANNLTDSVNDQRGSLTGYYQTMMGSGGGYTPQSISARRIDDSAIRALDPALQDFATTGGFTPGREESIMGTVNSLKNNGGLSDENIARIRGNGGFDEFATTGGYDPTARANIKAQALSPISSMASTTRDELDRRRALAGGYAPGFDAANRQLQRDTSRAIADTSLNANVMLQEKINQGRQWGIGGLAGAETNIGGLKQQGLQSAGTLETNLQDLISRYRAAGLSMQQASAKALADIDAANVGNELSASQFNANSANQGQIFNITNKQGQYAAGVGGLQGLQDQELAQLIGERDRQQQLLNERTNANLGLLGNQTQLAVQPGVGGNIMGAVGAAAGLAGDIYTGGLKSAVDSAVR
jgi:hypothetical protein